VVDKVLKNLQEEVAMDVVARKLNKKNELFQWWLWIMFSG